MQRASALWPAALPEGLSALVGAGVTLGAMVGDQSLRKRWWGDLVGPVVFGGSGGDRVGTARDLLLQPPDLSVGRAVAKQA